MKNPWSDQWLFFFMHGLPMAFGVFPHASVDILTQPFIPLLNKIPKGRGRSEVS